MARVVAFIPDLLFGSNVLGALRAAGHDATLATDAGALTRELEGADVLVVDLTTLRRWAVWEARFGIVSRAPDVGRMFDPTFAASAASAAGR